MKQLEEVEVVLIWFLFIYLFYLKDTNPVSWH